MLRRTSLQIVATCIFSTVMLGAYAQTGGLQVKVDVCRGEAKVLSQKQTAQGVDLEVEVSIADCKGTCIGSLEYSLLFEDAQQNKILWQMSEDWEWRSVDKAFTVQLHEQAPANATLKEVPVMKVGRCSCSTVSATATSTTSATLALAE